MAFTLPKLPYELNALEPAIDARTMEIHWGKHHQTYVNNANAAVENTDFAGWDVEKILRNLSSLPADKQGPVRNNVGGHANHSFFWDVLTAPAKAGKPAGALAQALDALGGYEKFKADFAKAGLTRFGSGWAWLVLKADKSLAITSTANQDSPLSEGQTPLLALDVWEHAYYLNYQNRRADYIEAFFSVINWGKVGELYQAAIKA